MSELDLPPVRGQLLRGETLAPFTWFRVGGPADALFLPADAADLAQFLAALPAEIPLLPIGVGSNLIVRDGGVPGVVIRLAGRAWAQIEALDGARIKAGAGALDAMVAKAAAKAGVGGLEFYAGIPGTIGGALTMNAGCYGSETKDVLIEATALDRSGKRLTLTNADFGFTYRHNALSEGLIFLDATYQGAPDDPAAVTARMAEITTKREASQPIREKTGGSTFKNPIGPDGEKLSAWKLNDEAGMRGYRRGGAQVSEKHANFLINTGDATAADIEGLGENVRAAVKSKHGIELEWEIKRVGSWWPRTRSALNVISVAAGPRDLQCDRRFVRWLASSFSQDSDIIYGTEEFDGVVSGATLAFPKEDLPDLQRELRQMIEEVRASDDDEPTKVQRYWVNLGGELWPDDVTMVQGLERIEKAIETRIAAS